MAKRGVVSSVISTLFLALFSAPTLALDFTVNTESDSIDVTPGDGICADAGGSCSLRAAVIEANASAGNDVIQLPAGIYSYSIPNSAGNEDLALSGDLDIVDTLSINGAGAAETTIHAAQTDRVFQVLPAVSLSLSDVKIAGGQGTDFGGGVLNQGKLVLNRVHIDTNRSLQGGGGISCAKDSVLIGKYVVISNNVAGTLSKGGYGGGLHTQFAVAAEVDLSQALIQGNLAMNNGNGGGVYIGGNNSYSTPVGGDVTLSNVVITENMAGLGAGIQINQGARMYLINDSITANTNQAGSAGAGIMGNGATSHDILNTLIAGNMSGSTVYNLYQVSNSSSLLWGSINPAYFDKGVPYGYNIIADSTTDLLEDELSYSSSMSVLGAYQLLAGSAAIDAADPDNFPVVDIFDTSRPEDGTGDAHPLADIGPHEYIRPEDDSSVMLMMPAILSAIKHHAESP